MIISVFGKEGSGKTTIACSLAEIISKKQRTLLVSAETRYGIIQRRFKTSIDKNRSMYLGFLNEFENKGFYKSVRERLGIVSLADEDDITSYNDIEETIIKNSIQKMKEDFDVIIFDCTSRATDELTYHYLEASDKVINVVDSSIDGMVFQNAHEKLLSSEILKGKTINVLSKHIESNINFGTIKSVTSTNYEVVYQYKDSVLQDVINSVQNRYVEEKTEDLLDEINGLKEENFIRKTKFQKAIGRIFA